MLEVKTIIYIPKGEYCNTNCAGQGWSKKYCSIFGEKIAFKRQGRGFLYFKCDKCLSACQQAENKNKYWELEQEYTKR